MFTNVGIYKITSPSGKVYIGQSLEIKKRAGRYRRMECAKQKKLYASLLKYGWPSHQFEVIQELPKDASLEVINAYEIFYINQYRECGVILLNLKEGGRNASHVVSEESKEKIRAARAKQVMFKGRKASEETKKKQSEAAKKRGNVQPIGYTHSESAKLKMSLSSKGRRSWNKGCQTSNETKNKQSAAKKGRTGGLCPNSRKIECIETGIIYDSIGIAAKAKGLKRTTLNAQLSGANKKTTSLKYI